MRTPLPLRLLAPTVAGLMLCLPGSHAQAEQGGDGKSNSTASGPGRAEPAQVRLDADFPGGNIVVEKVEGDTVFLKPDQRDTRKDQWWFWWYFRVRNAREGTLKFRFTEKNPIGVRGPAASQDGGLTWRWMGADSVRQIAGSNAWEFAWRFGTNDPDTRFCFAMPYQEADLTRFLGKHRENAHLAVETLCSTKKGRGVELLRLGRLDGQAPHRVLITARHHACECMASHVLEGLMEGVLAETDSGRRWQTGVELMVVPFVDKDGVEDGDQGKYRTPRDHNRDYGGTSLYASVAALRERVPRWSAGRLAVALDLHCPHIRGAYNEQIYFVGSEDTANWMRVRGLAETIEQVQKGPLKYRANDNLPYGTAWNVKANYEQGISFAAWARELAPAGPATSMEFPYANTRGQEITIESAHAFGHDLADAIIRYVSKHD